MSRKKILIFAGCMLVFLLAAVLNEAGIRALSASMMLLVAAALYGLFYIHTKNVVNLPGLLSLFWLGGIGVAGFKLSELSANHWSIVVWTCVLGFYVCYILAYFGREMWRRRQAGTENSPKVLNREMDFNGDISEHDRTISANRLLICIVGTAAVSLAAFIIEVIICGYIPALVVNTPHAYSYFHVSGVHYFTVSACFVHPLTLLYMYWKKITPGQIPWKHPKTWILLACNLVAIMVPILCVSRYFLIMAVALTLVTFLAIVRNTSWKRMLILVGGCVILLIPAYVVLTILRGHDVEYLNSIFEMKNAATPIFITQPYMYVANNYENFNALVNQLPEFVLGRRMLYPLFALTGLKFVFPNFIVGFIYYTKTELTTLTIIYDAYYDFGIPGVLIFGAVLGAASSVISEHTARNRNPVAFLFYAQIAMYMVLSFFTTWFSNPTTWFWLILTGMMFVFVGFRKKEKKQT